MNKLLNKSLIAMTLTTSLFAGSSIVSGNITQISYANTDNKTSDLSKSEEDANRVAEKFYQMGDAKLLKKEGFKVKEQADGVYMAIKNGVGLSITPNQAKELGYKVDKKYLTKEVKPTEVKTQETTVSEDNTLVNGKDTDSVNTSEREVVETKTIKERELNWVVVGGMIAIALGAIGVLLIPTKKKNNKK